MTETSQSKVHFVGMGGIGMSGIAEILLSQGYIVSGSDLKDTPLLERLHRLGATVSIGHRAESVAEAETVVFSSAVSRDNPELLAARRRGLQVFSRGQMLAELMRTKQGISIAGTHGKTTTTSMIAVILLEADLDPTLLIGARLPAVGSNARAGQGSWLLAESDESDRSFLLLSPFCTVVTNIDLDHMDEYEDLADLQQAFLTHMQRVPQNGLVIACRDDPHLSTVLKKIHRPMITYGLGRGADISAQKLDLSWPRSVYQCYEGGNCLGKIELDAPGFHNVVNSLAAVAVGLRILELPFSVIQQALAKFQGPERRLQIKGEKHGVCVIDDYAHHPQEVRAALKACRMAGRRTVAVFQPHRYSRTQQLMEELSRCFVDADVLYLTDIYSAGEAPLPNVTGERLAQQIRRHRQVRYLPDRQQLLTALQKESSADDLLITMGAGDVWEIGEAFLAKDEQQGIQ